MTFALSLCAQRAAVGLFAASQPLDKIGQDITGIGLQCSRDVDELDHVEPPLAALIFCDEGLRPAKLLGDIGLREIPRPAQIYEQIL